MSSQQVAIRRAGVLFYVNVPDNSLFEAVARRHAGTRREGSRGANVVWCFEKEQEEPIRAACREYFGNDGGDSEKSCLLEVTVRQNAQISDPSLRLAGRLLAFKSNLRGKVVLGDGVSLSEGELLPWEGKPGWLRTGPEMVTLHVFDVPVRLAIHLIQQDPLEADLIQIISIDGDAKPVADARLWALEDRRDVLADELAVVKQRLAA